MRGSIGSKIHKSWNLETLVFKQMKSGFDWTNLEQVNYRKRLNPLCKHISSINDPKMAIIIPIIFPWLTHDFPMNFLWGSQTDVFWNWNWLALGGGFRGNLGKLWGQSKVICNKTSNDFRILCWHLFKRSGIDPGHLAQFFNMFSNFREPRHVMRGEGSGRMSNGMRIPF